MQTATTGICELCKSVQQAIELGDEVEFMRTYKCFTTDILVSKRTQKCEEGSHGL
jgi:hypothetical protein